MADGSVPVSREDRSSLEKGLALLQQLSAAEAPMLVSELAAAAGLNRATAYRLCEVLERNGWLLGVEAGSRRQFHLGSTALGFAVLVASRFGIEERVQPIRPNANGTDRFSFLRSRRADAPMMTERSLSVTSTSV